MKIIVASNHSSNYFNNRIAQECSCFSIDIQFFNPYDSDIPVLNMPILWRVTGINYNDNDLKKCIINNIQTMNPVNTLLVCRDKELLFNKFGKMLNLAHTISFKNFILNEIETSDVVIKTIRGNQGRGVYFFNNIDEIETFIQNARSRNDLRFIVQPRLYGSEYRIFLMKNYDPIILKRISCGLKANFHQNAQAKLITTNMFDELISNVKKSLNFDYLALDVIQTISGPFIIDVNTVCGIEQLEKLSGVNIAKRILKNLLNTTL